MAEVTGKQMDCPVYKIHAAVSGAADLKKLAFPVNADISRRFKNLLQSP